jgi:hypothetical protein
MTDFSRLSRFGMMFKPLTANRGEELLTLYLAAFPARTSLPQARAQESTGNDQECGSTWRGWLAKYDPVTSLWKIAQCSLLEDLIESLVTFPRSGMTQGGLLWELPTLAHRTSATGSGLWATPTASDGMRGGTITPSMTGVSLAQQIKTPHRWPTPLATDGSKCPSGSLARAVNPALQATFRNKEEGRNWPTPAARDYRHPNAKSYAERGGGSKGEQLPNAVGGALNPTWVEWLMGWPLGWTDLKPLETDKFRQWQQQHGIYCQESEAA